MIAVKGAVPGGHERGALNPEVTPVVRDDRFSLASIGALIGVRLPEVG
jgi:hypothetical protein